MKLSEAQKRVLRSIQETGKLYAKDLRTYQVLKDRGLVKREKRGGSNGVRGVFVLSGEGKTVLDTIEEG